MKFSRPMIAATLLLLCVAGRARPVAAQQASLEDDPPIKITLYPAAAPTPALKHALLPRYGQQIEGNAAVYYGKVTAEQSQFFSNQELWSNIDRWESAPLEELKEVEFISSRGGLMHQLDLASRCEYCDWQLPVREVRFFTILLPEVQQTRQFGRILSAQTRIQVARGNYDEAILNAGRGYALAGHVSEGETIINALVGLAIEAIISNQVHTMIQQPDAPNLYWALTELPSPLVDMRRGISAEMNVLELSFPQLRDLEQTERTPEQWRELLETFLADLADIAGLVGDVSPAGSAGRDEASLRLATLAMVLRGYPLAKRALIEQGFEADRVEAMPVAQVVLIYSVRTYRQLSDDMFKWMFVPYHQSLAGMEAAEQTAQQAAREQREIIPLASQLIPALAAVRVADVRSRQRIAMLRTLEALRMHAAANEGQLPDSLQEVELVPVPDDPATGQPFAYRRQGDTAWLTATALRSWQMKYEITMGKN